MKRNPAAAGHRLPAQLDGPAIGQSVAPLVRPFARAHRLALGEIFGHAHRRRPRGRAHLNDLAPGDAGFHAIGIEPIEIDEAAVADDHARIGVENADAQRHGVDGLLVPRHFVAQALDLDRLDARDGGVGFVGGKQQLCERGILRRNVALTLTSRPQVRILRNLNRLLRERDCLPELQKDRIVRLMDSEADRGGAGGPRDCDGARTGWSAA